MDSFQDIELIDVWGAVQSWRATHKRAFSFTGGLLMDILFVCILPLIIGLVVLHLITRDPYLRIPLVITEFAAAIMYFARGDMIFAALWFCLALVNAYFAGEELGRR